MGVPKGPSLLSSWVGLSVAVESVTTLVGDTFGGNKDDDEEDEAHG